MFSVIVILFLFSVTYVTDLVTYGTDALSFKYMHS